MKCLFCQYARDRVTMNVYPGLDWVARIENFQVWEAGSKSHVLCEQYRGFSNTQIFN